MRAWLIFRLLPVVSQVFRTAFFYLLAGLVLLLAIKADGRALLDFNGLTITQPVAVAFITIISIIVIVHSPRLRPKARFENHDVPTRIRHLSDLIRSCERELFMVTGELGHDVYNDPTVIAAFAAIPRTASVEIFITKGRIDPERVGIKRLIVERGWPVYLAPKRLGHVVVVDRVHVRIERRDGPDAPRIRYAVYEYGALDLAENVRQRVLDGISFKEPYKVRLDEPIAARRDAGQRPPAPLSAQTKKVSEPA